MHKDDAAFLMIDIQNDFCPGGALAVTDGDAVVPVVNSLQKRFGVRILLQDWHPSDHKSFAENHFGAEPFSVTKMPYGNQVLWPRHCVQGSWGAKIHRELLTDGVDLILRKGFRAEIDSYSAFFENDKNTPTGLAGYLRERGIRKVVLTGLATDFCVYYSAVDAAQNGFEVTVVSDACRPIDLDGSLDAAITDMKAKGVTITTSVALK